MNRPDDRRHGAAAASRPLVATLLAVLVASALGFGIGVGTVAAGDRVAVIEPSPSSVEADPGETFTVEITMASDGGYDGTGVGSVDFVARYHPDYLEITDVDRGPWLEGDPQSDAAVTTERRLAHENGTAVLEQRRTPMDEGTTGTAVLATLTVAVAADAPPSTATIDFGESRVEPPRGWPLSVDDQVVTVAIDGGGDDVPAFDHPDPDALETVSTDGHDGGGGESTPDDGSDGASADETVADERNGTDDGDEAADTDDDAIPGFTAPFSALLVVAFAIAATGFGDETDS